MVESITININGVSTQIEIPFGYIPILEDGPLKSGDKVYMITSKVFSECLINEIKHFQVRDYYLVIRPTMQ